MATNVSSELAPEKRNLQLLGFFTLMLLLGWVIFFTYAVHASLAPNSVHLPFSDSLRVKVFMPETWTFFTADSRAENILPFKRQSAGTWVSVSLAPNLQASSLFGIKRGIRAQRVEIISVLTKTSPSELQDCAELPTPCLERLPVTDSVINPSPRPTVCGDIGFVIQKPVPWAWKASQTGAQQIIMPSRVIRMNVRCS
jgi:antimicrobial peptide system SdpA family protein